MIAKSGQPSPFCFFENRRQGRTLCPLRLWIGGSNAFPRRELVLVSDSGDSGVKLRESTSRENEMRPFFLRKYLRLVCLASLSIVFLGCGSLAAGLLFSEVNDTNAVLLFRDGTSGSRWLYLLFLLLFEADIAEAQGAVHFDSPLNPDGQDKSKLEATISSYAKTAHCHRPAATNPGDDLRPRYMAAVGGARRSGGLRAKPAN